MEPTEANNQLPTAEANVFEEKDSLLLTLVEHVNSSEDAQMGITLQVKGLLVTGTLIPGDKYFKLFASAFSEASSNEEVAKANYETFNSWGDQYRDGREAKRSDNDEERSTTYIHLENCDFLSPSNISNISGLWRGKIAQVDGFMLGRLRRNKSENA